MENSIIGSLTTKLGDIKVISSDVSSKENRENFLVRQGFRRNDHKVTPGLYAIGKPTENSEVFVTANYKISVDAFRDAFKGDGWLLILDTHGINVWCAAGKGTFGTSELIRMIAKCRLSRLVKHKRLIVPQLGAPGVSAYKVKQKTGFDVVFGPVRAEDIPAFLDDGLKATKNMRHVTFELKERLILTPLEFLQSMRYTLAATLFIIIAGLFGKYDTSQLGWIWSHALALVSATLVGTVLFPLCLPLLKGRRFTTKALPLSAIWACISYFGLVSAGISRFEAIGSLVFGVVLIELFALNFTGATPITSYTETKEETLKVVPYMIGSYIAGMVLFCLSIGRVI